MQLTTCFLTMCMYQGKLSKKELYDLLILAKSESSFIFDILYK